MTTTDKKTVLLMSNLKKVNLFDRIVIMLFYDFYKVPTLFFIKGLRNPKGLMALNPSYIGRDKNAVLIKVDGKLYFKPTIE